MSAAIPPAPPAPPPTLQSTPKVLVSSQRPTTNRIDVVRVRAAEPTKRPPFANVDAETLQHAAARLRPTQYNKPLLPRGEESVLGRPSVVSAGGYRPNQSEHDPVAVNQTGATIHAPSAGPKQFGAIGVVHGHSVPINRTPQSTTYSSTSSYSTNFNSPTPLPPSQPPPPVPAQSYSSYSSSSYVSPTQQQQRQPRDFSYISRLANDFAPSNNYAVQQSSYQSPSNGFVESNEVDNEEMTYSNGIQTYKTYTSTTTTQVGGSDLPSKSGSNLIGNPKEYIHDFATRTPVAVLSPSQKTPVTASASNYSYTTTHRTTTPKPSSYAEELRNSALTERQKQSNQYQNSTLPERQVPNSFSLYEYEIDVTPAFPYQKRHRRPEV